MPRHPVETNLAFGFRTADMRNRIPYVWRLQLVDPAARTRFLVQLRRDGKFVHGQTREFYVALSNKVVQYFDAKARPQSFLWMESDIQPRWLTCCASWHRNSMPRTLFVVPGGVFKSFVETNDNEHAASLVVGYNPHSHLFDLPDLNMLEGYSGVHRLAS